MSFSHDVALKKNLATNVIPQKKLLLRLGRLMNSVNTFSIWQTFQGESQADG